MRIEILSPVHVGTGEKKNKMNFIERNGNAYFIKEELFNSEILKRGLLDKFMQWVKQGGNDISQFLKHYRETEKTILNDPLYVLPIKGVINPRQPEVVLHIKDIKDPKSRFYIPGSSIKGAIRTVLLYTVLEETKPVINNLLYGISGTDIKGVLNVAEKDAKWAGMEIEKFVFRAGVKKEANGKITINYSDAKYDLLKFIHFSDAYPIKAEYSIMPIRTFSSVSKTLMNVKSHITNIEVIKTGELSCDLEIDMKNLLLLKDIAEKEEWIGLRDKFSKVFGFNLDELHTNNLKEYEEKIIERLFYACNKFAIKKIEEDFKLFRNKEIKVHKECGTSTTRDNKCPKCHRSVQSNEILIFGMNLDNNYPKDFPSDKGTIELGFGGGWKGKTTGLYFDKTIIDEFRKRFEGRWHGKFRDSVPFWLFPKTMRVAFWLESDVPRLYPIGWVKVIE